MSEKCRYCGDTKRIQIVSPVSDHAWADCFCVKAPAAASVEAGTLEDGLTARVRSIKEMGGEPLPWRPYRCPVRKVPA